MKIETADKTYFVIGYLGQDAEKERYLCECAGESQRYLIIRFRERDLIAPVVDFLYEQVENEAFSDLAECFVFQDCFHLVFRFPQGEPLEDKILREYCGIEERLELEKKLLERMVLLSMPCYFQSHCLLPGNVYVTRSLDIFFGYTADDLRRWRSYTMKDVQQELSRLTEFLFQDELKKEVVEPMEDFLDVLQEEVCADYLEIYRRFQTVYEQMLGLSGEDMKTPKTWVFRLWDRVRKLFRPMKRIAVVAILVFGLIYLVWTIADVTGPSKPAAIMTRIGTEEI